MPLDQESIGREKLDLRSTADWVANPRISGFAKKNVFSAAVLSKFRLFKLLNTERSKYDAVVHHLWCCYSIGLTPDRGSGMAIATFPQTALCLPTLTTKQWIFHLQTRH
jgi:hypothetical protein